MTQAPAPAWVTAWVVPVQTASGVPWGPLQPSGGGCRPPVFPPLTLCVYSSEPEVWGAAGDTVQGPQATVQLGPPLQEREGPKADGSLLSLSLSQPLPPSPARSILIPSVFPLALGVTSWGLA